MTTLNEARQAVYDRFVTNWGTRTTFTFENEEFDEPATGDWVRVSVKQTASGQETLGPKTQRKYIRNASVMVQVFTPTNIGKTTADGHATTAAGIFEGESFSGLNCNDALIREGGQDGKWDITLVEVAFFYEETK